MDLHSAFYLARAVVPGMKARGRGSIIALGGQSAITGRPNTAAVTAAKSGLLGLIRALAAELGPFGIRANMVVPGFIDTERRYAEWYPEFKQTPPGDPAQRGDLQGAAGADVRGGVVGEQRAVVALGAAGGGVEGLAAADGIGVADR